MAEPFSCWSCGSEEFYEHRLELIQQKQAVFLERAGGALRPADYLGAWDWYETETLFVNGYECTRCAMIYSPDGRRLRELLEDPSSTLPTARQKQVMMCDSKKVGNSRGLLENVPSALRAHHLGLARVRDPYQGSHNPHARSPARAGSL